MDEKKLYFAIEEGKWKLTFENLLELIYYPSVGVEAEEDMKVPIKGKWVEEEIRQVEGRKLDGASK